MGTERAVAETQDRKPRSSTILCRNLYNSLPDTERAAACQQCGICDEKCPQQIEISQIMGRVEQEFGKRPN